MLKAISRVLFWTYPRGSWQYDLMCIGILLFIFLTPRWVFDHSDSAHTTGLVEDADQRRAKTESTVKPLSPVTSEAGPKSSEGLAPANHQSP